MSSSVIASWSGVPGSARQTGGAVAVAAFGTLVSAGHPFVTGMRISLLSASVLVLATAAVTPVLLGRKAR
ncbi:MAG TPA: hypothetical protein VGX23_06895 [Actinocrinis sp.]|nr:hypothetical protein [Actinocrinis sp.]